MHFRSVQDMNRCIVENLRRVPRDVDVIVGIPRSGLLAANLLSAYLNRPLTDVEGAVTGRLIASGPAREPPGQGDGVEAARRLLVLDDSIYSGAQMRAAMARMEQAGLGAKAISAAVYAAPLARNEVDLYMEVCPTPRYFEWNLMHHTSMPAFAVALEGVLCVDPVKGDPERAHSCQAPFREAERKFLPTQPIGYIVTCRAEEQRPAVERWLEGHGVQYEKLLMRKSPDPSPGHHTAFKADVYRSSRAELFIEDSPAEASEIARLSGKPVISLGAPRLIEPPFSSRALGLAKTARESPVQALRNSPSLLYRDTPTAAKRIARAMRGRIWSRRRPK